MTINAAELRSLLAAAKEHNVFFMEAMWTRFQPLVLDIKRIIDDGILGMPITVHADLSVDFDIYSGLENEPALNQLLLTCHARYPKVAQNIESPTWWRRFA